MAIRAKQVCIEEAILVNNFFEAYGRTFHFQNQSYLLSYCFQTAATINLQQIVDPNTQRSPAAAERLATSLSTLQTEDKETPGVSWSSDTVKLRLGLRHHDNVDPFQPIEGRERSGPNPDAIVAPSIEAMEITPEGLDLSAGTTLTGEASPSGLYSIQTCGMLISSSGQTGAGSNQETSCLEQRTGHFTT